MSPLAQGIRRGYSRLRTVFMLGLSRTACSIFKMRPWYSSTTSRAWSTTGEAQCG